MVDFITFMVFSTLEYFSVLFISLVLWRFEIKKINKITYLSIILSGISYVFREYKLDNLSPLYTILTMILIFIFFFNAKLLYSIFISVSGYIISAVVQVVLVGILLLSKVITMNDLNAFSLSGHMLQLGTTLLIILIGLRVKLTGGGFSFIPEERYKRIKPIFSNTILVSLSVMLTSVVLATLYLLLLSETSTSPFICLILLILFFLSSILLFFLYKRDNEEFGL